MIKALLCDIEGTLVEKTGHLEKTIQLSLQESFKNLVQNYQVGLITGREFEGDGEKSAKERYHQFGLNGPLVIENGAILYPSFQTLPDNSLQLGGLSETEIVHIKKTLMQKGFLKEMIFDPYKSFSVGLFMKGFPEVAFTDLSFYYDIKTLFSESYSVTYSSASVDITSQNTSKGNALQMYASLKEIKLHEIAVFGDSKNDQSMFDVVLQNGGFGFYVGTNQEMSTWIEKFPNGFVWKGYQGVKGTLNYLVDLEGYIALGKKGKKII